MDACQKVVWIGPPFDRPYNMERRRDSSVHLLSVVSINRGNPMLEASKVQACEVDHICGSSHVAQELKAGKYWDCRTSCESNDKVLDRLKPL